MMTGWLNRYGLHALNNYEGGFLFPIGLILGSMLLVYVVDLIYKRIKRNP